MKNKQRITFDRFKPHTLFMVTLSVVGIIVFCFDIDLSFVFQANISVIISLIISVLLMKHFLFQFPPKGTPLSMDSTIYLSIIFVFGLQTALISLFFCYVIHISYNRKKSLLVHLANFSIYTLMIVSAHSIFRLTGGHSGVLISTMLFPYIAALFIFFIVNLFLCNFYFFLQNKKIYFLLLKNCWKRRLRLNWLL